MPLFANEIELCGGRVAIQTWLLQRRIENFVSTVLNRGAIRGDLQREKLPTVRVWEGRSVVLYHRLSRDQLQNRACRVFLIGDAIPEDADGFLELFGIRVLNPRISDFRQLEHTAEAFFRDHEVISPDGCGTQAQNYRDDLAHHFSVSPSRVRQHPFRQSLSYTAQLKSRC